MSVAYLFDTCAVQRYLDARAQQGAPGIRARVEEAMAASGGLYISAVTAFEIRRGLEVLAREGKGRRKRRLAELFLRDAVILELGDRGGAAWRVGIRLYADGQLHKPAITLSDGDLLIAATAIAHERILVTADRRLYENLARLGYGESAELLPLA